MLNREERISKKARLDAFSKLPIQLFNSEADNYKKI